MGLVGSVWKIKTAHDFSSRTAWPTDALRLGRGYPLQFANYAVAESLSTCPFWFALKICAAASRNWYAKPHPFRYFAACLTLGSTCASSHDFRNSESLSQNSRLSILESQQRHYSGHRSRRCSRGRCGSRHCWRCCGSTAKHFHYVSDHPHSRMPCRGRRGCLIRVYRLNSGSRLFRRRPRRDTRGSRSCGCLFGRVREIREFADMVAESGKAHARHERDNPVLAEWIARWSGRWAHCHGAGRGRRMRKRADKLRWIE